MSIPNTSSDIFQSPETHAPLQWDPRTKRLFNAREEFIATDDVISFLPEQNQNYEGAYLNKVKYVPAADIFPFTIPLWMMTSGYVWEVRKQFSKGALLCELGCASGVNYFGKHFSMIGLDFSFESLRHIEQYQFKIQANAIALPFRDNSLDGIVSSFFWEHISPQDKVAMLKEFYRVIKPAGKVVMLYDVVTKNKLISKLKNADPEKYEELFLRGDYHIGYGTLQENEDKFKAANFSIVKHFGLERTSWQGNSVYSKLSQVQSVYGKGANILTTLTANRWIGYINMLAMRAIDITIGKLFHRDKSRIAISVLQKNK